MSESRPITVLDWMAMTCILLLALAIAAGVISLHRSFLHDDAFISLRYARSLLDGHGLVWQPGDRVEGYTNFAFVMATAALGALGLDLIVAARAINFTAVALIPIVVGWFLYRGPARGHPIVAAIACAATFCSTPLLVWALGGLEAPLVTLWLALGTVNVLTLLMEGPRRRPALMAGLAFSLAILTRPDAILILAVAIPFVLLSAWHREGRSGLVTVAVMPAVAALVVGAHEIWRLYYYGEWMPNTYHAKIAILVPMMIASGFEYVGSFIVEPPYLVPIAGLALIPALADRRWRIAAFYLAAVTVFHVAYVVRVGGDHMPAWRLLVPLIPMLAILVYAGWDALRRPFPLIIRAGLTSAALIALMLQIGQTNPDGRDAAALTGSVVGRYANSAFPAGSLVASNAAGALPYYAPTLRFIDMLGLNDRHIARREIDHIQLPWQLKPGHGKGDGAYVFGRRPDYIILGPGRGTDLRHPYFLSDFEIAKIPEFKKTYRRREVIIDVSRDPAFRRYTLRHKGVRFIYYERIH